MRRLLLIAVAAVSSLPDPAGAFPAAIRHGYVNCTSCHVSPTGGGLLTPYGRQLSGELLSSWSGAREADFAYGLVKTPSWLLLGGDFVGVWSAKESSPEGSQFELSRADLEVATLYWKLRFVGTLGRRESQDERSGIISRRHYLQYQASPRLSLRTGRFFPSFGMGSDDGSFITRRALGWGEGMESYNLEAHWIDERMGASLTAILGRPGELEGDREKGMAATGSLALARNHKVGVSHSYRVGRGTQRHAAGAFAMLGFHKRLYLLTELAFQRARRVWAVYGQERLGYEVVQGLSVIVTHELSRDLVEAGTLRSSYGVGAQWLPRPHLEAQLSWMRRREVELPAAERGDRVRVLLRFYP